MAHGDSKSRRCVYCGARVWLAKARRVAHAESSREACELVQRLKKKSACSRRSD